MQSQAQINAEAQGKVPVPAATFAAKYAGKTEVSDHILLLYPLGIRSTIF